jgi:hypothetical protein
LLVIAGEEEMVRRVVGAVGAATSGGPAATAEAVASAAADRLQQAT